MTNREAASLRHHLARVYCDVRKPVQDGAERFGYLAIAMSGHLRPGQQVPDAVHILAPDEFQDQGTNGRHQQISAHSSPQSTVIPPYPKRFLGDFGLINWKLVKEAEHRLKKLDPSYRRSQLWDGRDTDYLRLRKTGIVDVRQIPGVGVMRLLVLQPWLWTTVPKKEDNASQPISRIAALRAKAATLEFMARDGDSWPWAYERSWSKLQVLR